MTQHMQPVRIRTQPCCSINKNNANQPSHACQPSSANQPASADQPLNAMYVQTAPRQLLLHDPGDKVASWGCIADCGPEHCSV